MTTDHEWDIDEMEATPDSSRPITFQPPLPCAGTIQGADGKRQDCGKLTTTGRYWEDDGYIVFPFCQECEPDVLEPNPLMP